MVRIKKKATGFPRRNRNGISFMYRIRCGLNFDVDKTVVKRILCARISCIE